MRGLTKLDLLALLLALAGLGLLVWGIKAIADTPRMCRVPIHGAGTTEIPC